jgi:hypothetical protein
MSATTGTSIHSSVHSKNLTLCSLFQAGASLLLSTYLDRAGEKLDEELHLRGDEGVIIELL